MEQNEVKKLKLSKSQLNIIEQIKKNGKMPLSQLRRPTIARLVSVGVCNYNSLFDALILTGEYKQ